MTSWPHTSLKGMTLVAPYWDIRRAHNAYNTSCHLLGFSSIFFLISLIKILLLDLTGSKFEKLIFGGLTIELIVNQNIFESRMLNIPLCTVTRIFQIGDKRNPQVLIFGLNDRIIFSRIGALSRFTGQIGLWIGQTGSSRTSNSAFATL